MGPTRRGGLAAVGHHTRRCPVIGLLPDDPRYRVTSDGQVYGPAGLMKGSISTGGYRYVRINEKVRYVHSLVLEVFVGPRPDGQESLHANDIRTDNRLENLSWGTRSENMLGAVARGRHHQSRKTHCRNGHEFTPENTSSGIGKRGRWRKCRICKRASYRRTGVAA